MDCVGMGMRRHAVLFLVGYTGGNRPLASDVHAPQLVRRLDGGVDVRSPPSRVFDQSGDTRGDYTVAHSAEYAAHLYDGRRGTRYRSTGDIPPV